MEDKAGHHVPQVMFRIRDNYRWVSRSSDDFFKNKRVILFALPGAFTPICSTLHLPSYNDYYDTFRANGIDDVLCLAVNDGFVLEAWKKAEKADKITMLPDVDGEFSINLGFLVNKSDMCLGNRSWRYSMVVDNGVIEKMFLEPEGRGNDPYGASSAENMLHYLNPEAELPDSVTVYSKHGCLECEKVKDILKKHHVPYEEFFLHDDFSIKTVKALSGSSSLPQVFINGRRMKNLQEINDRYRLKLAS